ncbi:hypothetical protein J5893_01185 [bacterium]|nr:hypothetical protein [bacterium]
MNDLLAVFQNIDKHSRLDLFFDYTFTLEESAWQQAWELFKKFMRWVWVVEKKDGKDAVGKDSDAK